MWEAITGGCAANTYVVRTRVTKEEEEQGKKRQPLFILEEKSKCCCRCCCNGMQPFFMKFCTSQRCFFWSALCARARGP